MTGAGLRSLLALATGGPRRATHRPAQKRTHHDPGQRARGPAPARTRGSCVERRQSTCWPPPQGARKSPAYGSSTRAGISRRPWSTRHTSMCSPARCRRSRKRSAAAPSCEVRVPPARLRTGTCQWRDAGRLSSPSMTSSSPGSGGSVSGTPPGGPAGPRSCSPGPRKKRRQPGGRAVNQRAVRAAHQHGCVVIAERGDHVGAGEQVLRSNSGNHRHVRGGVRGSTS